MGSQADFSFIPWLSLPTGIKASNLSVPVFCATILKSWPSNIALRAILQRWATYDPSNEAGLQLSESFSIGRINWSCIFQQHLANPSILHPYHDPSPAIPNKDKMAEIIYWEERLNQWDCPWRIGTHKTLAIIRIREQTNQFVVGTSGSFTAAICVCMYVWELNLFWSDLIV